MTSLTLSRLSWWRRALLRLFRVEVRYGAVLAHLDSRQDQPLVVVCNHISLLDGPLLALASPYRMTFPVTPKHSVHNRFTRWGLRFMEHLGLGYVEVMNSNRPWAARALVRVLRSGGVVAIFPEGRIVGRNETLPDKPGVQWLSERTGAQVVRARIRGASDSRLFSPSGRSIWPKITVEF